MDVRRHIIVSMTSVVMLYGGAVHALGLGNIQLNSALHQPLDATIVLHGADDLTPRDIAVSLADAALFAKVGIERVHFLHSLRFTPVVQDGGLLVRVQSTGPVNEPYLNFLVQLKRPHGSLLREYTLLLDPPRYQPSAVIASAPVSTADNTRPSAAASRAPRTPVATKKPQPDLPQLQPDPQAQRYQSQSGDSLWLIAKTTRVDDSVPMRRQMLAIRALNPAAFVDGDMNRLRVGQTLVLPTAQQVGGTVRAASHAPAVSAEPAEIDNVAAPSSSPAQGRLRIAEPVEALALGNTQMRERLAALETRFGVLRDELEARDRQINSLQAELEMLRRAEDVERDTAALSAAEPETLAAPLASSSEGGSQQLTPGALAGKLPAPSGAEPPQSESQQTSIMSWWPALLALLAVIAGAIILRLRSGQNDVPGNANKGAIQPKKGQSHMAAGGEDVLDGVELYLAYGRIPEARALLETAIRAEPERVDLRLRQLAVLAQLGDVAAFTQQAIVARQLGADSGRIERLKATLADARERPDAESGEQAPAGVADQSALPAAVGQPAESNPGLLEEDSFSLDADWALLDDLDPSGVRRHARAASEQQTETFETNLNDFPEVGELDGDFAANFTGPSDKPSNP